jgi:chromosome segregation ATPase
MRAHTAFFVLACVDVETRCSAGLEFLTTVPCSFSSLLQEKIGQLEASMKSLRKVVGTLTKKSESFLSDAGRIELGLNEALLREKQVVREANASKMHLQGQMNTALQLLKQTQGQRDKLIAEMKSNASSMASHAQTLAQKDGEIADIQSKLDQTTRDLGETMAALDSTTLEREEAKKMLLQLQAQLDEASVMLGQLEEEKTALVQTCEQQEVDLTHAAKKAAQMEADLGAQRNQLTELMQQWSTLQKTHEASEATVETLTARLSSVQSELVQARLDLDTQRSLSSQQSSSFSSAQAQHRQEVEALNAKHRSEMEAVKNASGHELATVQAAQAREMEELKCSHARDIEKFQTELAHLKAQQQKELDLLKKNLNSSQEKNTQDLQDLTHQMDALQQAKALLQEQYNRSQMDLVASRSNLLHLTDKVGTSEIEISKLNGELQLVKMQLEKKNEGQYRQAAAIAA